MKLETEKTYIAHIKSLKGERWVEAERQRGKRERDREKERKRERGNMEVVLLEQYKQKQMTWFKG